MTNPSPLTVTAQIKANPSCEASPALGDSFYSHFGDNFLGIATGFRNKTRVARPCRYPHLLKNRVS